MSSTASSVPGGRTFKGIVFFVKAESKFRVADFGFAGPLDAFADRATLAAGDRKTEVMVAMDCRAQVAVLPFALVEVGCSVRRITRIMDRLDEEFAEDKNIFYLMSKFPARILAEWEYCAVTRARPIQRQPYEPEDGAEVNEPPYEQLQGTFLSAPHEFRVPRTPRSLRRRIQERPGGGLGKTRRMSSQEAGVPTTGSPTKPSSSEQAAKPDPPKAEGQKGKKTPAKSKIKGKSRIAGKGKATATAASEGRGSSEPDSSSEQTATNVPPPPPPASTAAAAAASESGSAEHEESVEKMSLKTRVLSLEKNMAKMHQDIRRVVAFCEKRQVSGPYVGNILACLPLQTERQVSEFFEDQRKCNALQTVCCVDCTAQKFLHQMLHRLLAPSLLALYHYSKADDPIDRIGAKYMPDPLRIWITQTCKLKFRGLQYQVKSKICEGIGRARDKARDRNEAEVQCPQRQI